MYGKRAADGSLICTPDLLDRMERAVENVRRRLMRATAALDGAGVPYAVAGGNAVAAWVATVDEGAVRNTQDVDILIERADLPRAAAALEAAGFVYRHAAGIDMFLDAPGARARDAVHILFAREKVRPEYVLPAPDLSTVVRARDGFRVLPLDDLTRMKLTSYRFKDRVHIQDFIGVGLLGEQHLASLPAPLAARLRELIENPES